MRLSDIQIFDGSKPDIFLDWKFRMLDKLRYNADHFTGTNNEEREGFKIAYIVSRLGGEASTQTLWRRQYKPYCSTTELLDHLTDLYGIHPEIAKDMCRQEFNKVEQAPEQSFDDFYRAFIKYSVFRNEDDLVHEMERKVNSALRKVLLPLPEDFTSLPAITKWLKKVDYRHRAAKQLKQDEEKLEREQKLKQYRKQVVKTEKALAQQRQERIRKEEEAAQRRRQEKRIQARDEKAFQEVEAQHQRRLKDIQAREERAKLTDQQKQNKQAEQARQQKQNAVAFGEKKLVKKQSSKSRKGPEIAARSHDEIYSVQIAAALQHQHNVDDVKCIGLPASYESCDEAFFPTSYWSNDDAWIAIA